MWQRKSFTIIKNNPILLGHPVSQVEIDVVKVVIVQADVIGPA